MQTQYNNVSHCKVNGTERSIMTALSQTLRLVSNPVTTGKVPEFLFAACRINKFNLNIVDFIALMSKLKTIEMMYGIEIKVAVATVFEMQRQLKFSNLNESYMHVKSTHPNDSDDVALKCYHYLWATTNSFGTAYPINEHSNDIVNNVKADQTATPANTPNTNTPNANTPTNSVYEGQERDNTDTTDTTSDSWSEEVAQRRSFREAGKRLGKKTLFEKK
jgi:hypothetical protein